MIFDDGQIDAATPKQLGDAPGFPEIAADSGIGNCRDLDAVERLVHRRADHQRRARISAMNDQIANAKLDRSGKPRAEMRIAQHDIGNFRLARHSPHSESSRRAARRLRASLHARVGRDNRPIDHCRLRRILLEGARRTPVHEQGSCGRVSESAQPMVSSRTKLAYPYRRRRRSADGRRVGQGRDRPGGDRGRSGAHGGADADDRSWPATPRRATSSARRGSPASWRPRRPPTSFRSAIPLA